MVDVSQILTLEAISNRMWSAEERLEYDGWLLQFASGYNRRPNSVSVIGDSTLPLDEKFAFCEAQYAQHGLPPIFKLIPSLPYQAVDEALLQRGYGNDALNSVQTMDLTQFPAHRAVSFFDGLNDEWIEAFARMKNLSPTQVIAHGKILQRIPFPSCYGYLQRAGQIVGVAIGIHGDGYYGIYDVVTDERFRGQGVAREVMNNVLAHGKASGAHTAFLQMTRSNMPALGLYKGLGFTEAYTYMYRLPREVL